MMDGKTKALMARYHSKDGEITEKEKPIVVQVLLDAHNRFMSLQRPPNRLKPYRTRGIRRGQVMNVIREMGVCTVSDICQHLQLPVALGDGAVRFHVETLKNEAAIRYHRDEKGRERRGYYTVMEHETQPKP